MKHPTPAHPKRQPKLLGLVMTLLLVVFAAVAISGVQAPGAFAATSSTSEMSGSSWSDAPFLAKSGSTTYGKLQVYYSSANGGTNYAGFDHAGSLVGVSRFTEVWLYRCTESTESDLCHPAATSSQRDVFSYYAGAVKVTSTNKKCVQAIGQVLSGTSSSSSVVAYGTSRVNGKSARHCG